MAATRAAEECDGLLLIDKPVGPTSHDVVGVVRRMLGQRRAGHAGTLDPDASGLLLIGLGRATRLLRFVTGLAKSYVGEVVLGISTSTLDASGAVTGTFAMDAVDLATIRAAAAGLTGPITQIPPMVSAVRVGGRRLHELARAGVEVEREPRPVEVYRFDVVALENGIAPIEVECSSGTYVRTLAADLGTVLGGGAHLRQLRRTAIGPFRVEDATPLDSVSWGAVHPLEELVGHLDAVEVSGELVTFVGHGRILERSALGLDGGAGPWAVLAGQRLLAVYEPRGANEAKPLLVMPEAAS